MPFPVKHSRTSYRSFYHLHHWYDRALERNSIPFENQLLSPLPLTATIMPTFYDSLDFSHAQDIREDRKGANKWYRPFFTGVFGLFSPIFTLLGALGVVLPPELLFAPFMCRWVGRWAPLVSWLCPPLSSEFVSFRRGDKLIRQAAGGGLSDFRLNNRIFIPR